MSEYRMMSFYLSKLRSGFTLTGVYGHKFYACVQFNGVVWVARLVSYRLVGCPNVIGGCSILMVNPRDVMLCMSRGVSVFWLSI